MGQPLEIIKKEASKYTGEAFREHKEQIFEALRIMCQCSYLARESGLLALEEVADLWEEESSQDGGSPDSSGQYSDEALSLSIAGRDVPLVTLLIFAVRRIADAMDWDDTEEEILKEAVKRGYSGYEWYVAFIYLTGIRDVYWGVHPEHYYLAFRVMVPEQWLEDYDRSCRKWLEKLQKEDQERQKKILNDSFQREMSVKTAFHRVFGKMEAEKLKYIVKELDYKTLAAGTAFAQEPVRNRFLENMEKWKRALVMEEWGSRNGYHLKDILEAMDRMLIAAGLS